MVRLGKLAELSVTGWALLHRKALLLLLLCCCWRLPAHPAATPAVDFCASCHSSATCFQESGKSICICNYGFIGNGRTYCNDKDECLIGAYNICGNHSACHNTYGSFYCTCHEGFQPSNNNSNNTYIPNDGTYCKDIDECAIYGLCGNGATCKNVHGSYECYCMKGYRPENGTEPFRTDENITGSCTAVDCGFPLALPNTFIDSENKTTFGSNVTYKCQKGFVSEAGSSSTHICTADGKWEGSAFICTEIDCGRPPLVKHSIITMDHTTLFGSKAEYHCVEGFYSESGTNASICTEHGVWQPPTLSCKAVDCGAPPPLPNTSVLPQSNNTTYGSVVVYECQHGYAIESGNQSAVCTARGEWEGTDLVCRAVDCGAPPPLLNTLAGPHSNTSYGSRIVYECQYGYAIAGGNKTAVCNASGQWEGADLLCRAVDCGAPPSFPNVSAGPHSNTTYGSAIVYECHDGYIVESGNQTAVCNGRGQWEGADLVCKAVDCGAPPSFPNVSAGPHSNTTYGSAIVYECHNGYIAESGNQTAVCNGQGQWEGADIVCTEIDCGAPPVIPHTEMIWNNSTQLGSVVHYQCIDGFYSVGSGNCPACTTHQSWENVTFSCQALPAAKADIISNLSLVNETCVKWRKATGRAGWKMLYLVNIAGARWYQKEFFHKIIFNFTTDANTPMVCLRLWPGTNYTVNITAASPDGANLQATLTIKTAAIDCGSPPLIPHAKLSWDNSTGVGSVASYICEKGFRRTDGRNLSHCTSNGSWEVPDVICKAIDCGSPPLIPHAKLSWDNSTGVGSVASYICEKGFRRTDGRNLSHCTSNGSWEVPDVICKEINCGIPQRMPHSDLVWSGRSSPGSIARYLCKKGFKESGGRNYSLCTEEGVWEESTLTCTVKKFKINVTALNETCLQWRRADGERLYLLHVRGHRWYQEEFFHEMELNFPTDAENPVVCLDLCPGTNYTVNITAASSKLMVDFFVTTRIADPPLPDLKFVETQGPAPKLSLRRAEEKNGPISSYQVLVLPFCTQSTLNCNSLVRSSFFSNVTNTEGYVAAEILSKDFVHPLEFSLGDRRYYGDFYNAPLRRGKDYCVVLRITSEWNQERAQSCMAWVQIKELSTTRQHMTVVGLGSLAVVCFLLFISFSTARCCKRR